jgi:hypothetical protein
MHEWLMRLYTKLTIKAVTISDEYQPTYLPTNKIFERKEVPKLGNEPRRFLRASMSLALLINFLD